MKTIKNNKILSIGNKANIQVCKLVGKYCTGKYSNDNLRGISTFRFFLN